MRQEILNIKLEDLVLWTENPRDPITPDSNDQDVANKALQDKDNKWNLSKLVAEMGDFYDFSEIPTVIEEKIQKAQSVDELADILSDELTKSLMNQIKF